MIKNSFDAGSKRVRINVTVRLPHAKALALKTDIEQAASVLENRNLSAANKAREQAAIITSLRVQLLAHLVNVQDEDGEFLRSAASATSFSALSNLVDNANFIEFTDTGERMSLDDLSEVYLTIGTRSRLKEREAQQMAGANARDAKGEPPILGEKGVGRLSAMRLGSRLLTVNQTEYALTPLSHPVEHQRTLFAISKAL